MLSAILTPASFGDTVISFPFFGITLNPPSSFTLFGYEFYFYGLIIALAFLAGIFYCARISPRFGFQEDDVYDVAVWVIPCAIVGARVYFVLFQWDYFFRNPDQILAIRNGGLAVYGGILAGILAITLVCRRKKKPVLALLDLLVFGLLIGQAMGRWGNFMNREAFGSETALFCRMGLTDSLGNTVYVHPTFLYESLWNLTGFVWMTVWSRRDRQQFDGQLVLMYFLWYGIGRGWIEGLRTDSLYLWNSGIRVSQALSLLLALFSGVLLFLRLRKPHAPDELYRNVVAAAGSCVILPPENGSAPESGTGEPETSDQ